MTESDNNIADNDEVDYEDVEIEVLAMEHGLDKETAEKVKGIMEEYGVDEDEAIELEEAGLE